MMAKKPSTKRAQPKGDALPFPQTLEWYEDEETPEAKDKGAAQQPQTSPDVLALQKQIADLNAQISNMQKTNLALMQTPRVAPQAPGPLNLQGLPDPTLEPEKYAAEVAKRTEAHMAAQRRYEQEIASQEGAQNQTLNAVWEDFKERHAAYAQDAEKVEIVARRVAAKAAARGIDVNRYIVSDSFQQDVIKDYDKLFGAPKVEGGDEEEEDTTEDLRTSVIPSPRGQRPSVRPDPDEDEGSDMFAEIREWQQKTGFHR